MCRIQRRLGRSEKNGEGGVGVPDVVVQGVFEIHMFPLNFGFV
jgi:hypothetical protein